MKVGKPLTATIDPTRGHVSPTGNHYWYRKRREVSRLLAYNVSLAPGARVVELGAGSGLDIPLLASLYPNADILALDARREALDAFKQSFGDLPNVRSEWADLNQRLPLDDAAVDLAYCSEVVEHIPEPRAVFREVHRVLKANGHFLMTTPNQPNILQKPLWLKRWSGNHGPDQHDASQTARKNGEVELHGHITLLSIKKWEQVLSESGFELADARRGALMYGGRPWLDSEGMLALYFMAEALMDLVPLRFSRNISDQLIGLYRKV